jgi:predicted O-methyltransferase YrrM
VTARERMKIMTSRRLKHRPLRRFSRRVVQLAGSPMLHDFYLHSALLTASPADAARAVLGESVDYVDEYARVRERLDTQMAAIDRNFPDYFAVENSTALLLYTLVRHAKPSFSVEVGVADGRSTQVILSALDANKAGQLVSVDVNTDVGGGARGHPRWSLRVHSPGKSSSRQLRDLLAEVGPPDLFFHDGMHTYYDQYGEYLAAWEHMRPGSLFVSDDVDWSFAFIELTRAFCVEPVALIDRRKVVGVFRRP